MTTLFPRGYGGLPSYRFSSPDQVNTGYHNGRYPRRGVSFAPHYPTQPLYQPPFNANDRYLAPAVNQFQEPGLGTQLVMLYNQLDEQYRYEGYLRQLEKLRKQYWKQQGNALPWTMYSAPPPLLPAPPQNYGRTAIYEYEKETQYVPYPVYIQPGMGGYGTGGNLGYAYRPSITLGTGGGMNLPPKIRVIFIPTGQSALQQSYAGSLAMPPFLYNRMAQPLCSFPLPPPLPQIGSLPLTPAVQQMVMQRYSNPIAVLPFTSNWQMPQMMSGYPQVFQQQQQSILPATAFQSFPPSPQSYIPPPVLPPAPMLALQSFLPSLQSYIPPPVLPPAPMLAIQSFPSSPQSYIPPAPMSTFQSFPLAPQAYIPPPPPLIMPANIPALPPPSFQLPLSNAIAVPSSPEYSYSGYPSMCRACPPAPPPLNIPVTGHCWVQHCCACHQVPTPISNPNVRPGGGRITPLLRYPTVPQYVPEQIDQQQYQHQHQQYFHANAPVMMRPWLRKTPPLPPGAVLVSEEYIDRNGSYSRYNYPPRQHRQHRRSSDAKRRSTTVTSKTTSVKSPTVRKNNRSVSPGGVNKNNNNISEYQKPLKSKSTTSTSSSATSTSGLSTEYNKTTLHTPNTYQNTFPPQLNRESRNINFQYQYQTHELPTVYLLNRYLKSSSEASTLASTVETRSNYSSPVVKERSPISSPSNDSNSIKREPNLEKEDENLLRSPSQPNKLKEKLIIIREFRSNSPSTLSTISSSIAFSIINQDEDARSTTSTIKANKLEEDDVLRRNIF